MRGSPLKSVPMYEKDPDEINEIWSDTSASTLVVAQPSVGPSIHSYRHSQTGNDYKVKKTQTEINVNYFGANDGEIGVLKYKTPFSKGRILGDPSNSADGCGANSNVYIFENNSKKKKNHDAVSPATAAFSPHMKNKLIEKGNTPVIKIAIPRPQPMPKSMYGTNDEDEDRLSPVDCEPSVITDSVEMTVTSSMEDGQAGIVDTVESHTVNGLLADGVPDHVAQVEKHTYEDEALVRETKLRGLTMVEKRLSSKSEGGYSERCVSPSELSQGAFVRSSVVVPAVKFLPPQPTSPLGMRSGDYLDFGPSRGNPSSQSLSGVSGFFDIPLSNRSLHSTDSYELSSPAQRSLVKDTITSIDPTADSVAPDMIEQSPPTARSQSSIESQSTSKSIRSWVFDHASLRGSSFTPTTAQLSHHSPSVKRLYERRSRERLKDSASYNSSSGGGGRKTVGKEIWESVDDGSTVRSVEPEMRPIHTHQPVGWKLIKQPTSSPVRPKLIHSTQLTRQDDTRHQIASYKAIRRMRAREGEGMKWQGLKSHQQQLKCCDAAHITHMIAKMDAIEKSPSSSLNAKGEAPNRIKAEPVRLNRLHEDRMGTEPYILHLMSKMNQSSSSSSESNKDSSAGNANTTFHDYTRAEQSFYQSAMDSVDIDAQQEAHDAMCWAEISNEMENGFMSGVRVVPKIVSSPPSRENQPFYNERRQTT